MTNYALSVLKNDSAWEPLDSYLYAGLLLTNGFTRSGFGWEVIDHVELFKTKYPNSPLYNRPDLFVLAEEDITEIQYPNKSNDYQNYYFIPQSGTWEKLKSANDSTATKATQVFHYLGVMNESKVEPTGNESESDDDPNGARDTQSAKYIAAAEAKKIADPNLPSVSAQEKGWLNQFATAVEEWESKTAYGRLAQLAHHFSMDITETDFDRKYLEWSGYASNNPKLYPPEFQPGKVEYTTIQGISDETITNLTSVSSELDFANALALLQYKTWIILLTWKSESGARKYNGKNNKRKQYFQYICDLNEIYQQLISLENKKVGIVKPWLKQNGIIAYVMQKIKWMNMCGKTYVTVLEQPITGTILIDEFLIFQPLDVKYSILAKIQDMKNDNNLYIKWLFESGLKNFFEKFVVDKELNKWKSMINKAYRYKELWCLPLDWKAPVIEQKSEEGKNNVNDTKPTATNALSLPPIKRRRLTLDSATLSAAVTGFIQDTMAAQYTRTGNDTLMQEIDVVKLWTDTTGLFCGWINEQADEQEKDKEKEKEQE